MNDTYELYFCWWFRPKAMLVISEHSIVPQAFIFEAMQVSDTGL